MNVNYEVKLGDTVEGTPILGFILYSPYALKNYLSFDGRYQGAGTEYKSAFGNKNVFGFNPSNRAITLNEAVSAVRNGTACIKREEGSNKEKIYWNEFNLLKQLKE